MARLFNTFDATAIDPTQSGSGNLPVGRHPVVIVADDVIATKDNSGGYLALTLEIIDGDYKGTSGVMRLNLYNNSPKAVEIANRQLSAICHVVNVFRVEDVSVLHNIPFVVEVELQRDPEAAKKGYTEVKKVFYMDGSEPGKQGQQQQQNNGQGQGNGGNGGNGGNWQPNGGQNAGNQQQQQQQQQNNGAGNNSSSWQQNGGQNQQQQQPQNNGGGWQQNNSQGQGNGGNPPAWAR